MIGYILRWIAVLAIAFFAGKLMAKIKMPAILGWLIVGMLLGPHALGLIFAFLDVPIYLGFVFGGIALATAAAVINECIAVIAAQKGFELAGEIEKPQRGIIS